MFRVGNKQKRATLVTVSRNLPVYSKQEQINKKFRTRPELFLDEQTNRWNVKNVKVAK